MTAGDSAPVAPVWLRACLVPRVGNDKSINKWFYLSTSIFKILLNILSVIGEDLQAQYTQRLSIATVPVPSSYNKILIK